MKCAELTWITKKKTYNPEDEKSSAIISLWSNWKKKKKLNKKWRETCKLEGLATRNINCLLGYLIHGTWKVLEEPNHKMHLNLLEYIYSVFVNHVIKLHPATNLIQHWEWSWPNHVEPQFIRKQFLLTCIARLRTTIKLFQQIMCAYL